MYLGLRRDWSPLTGYAAAYYTILWKFILIQYTRVDTDDTEFDERYIMTAAARRTHERIEGYGRVLQLEIERYRSRGQPTPPTLLARYRRHVGPEYSFSESGTLMYTATVAETLTELNYDLSVHPARILPVDSEDSPDKVQSKHTDRLLVRLHYKTHTQRS